MSCLSCPFRVGGFYQPYCLAPGCTFPDCALIGQFRGQWLTLEDREVMARAPREFQENYVACDWDGFVEMRDRESARKQVADEFVEGKL